MSNLRERGNFFVTNTEMLRLLLQDYAHPLNFSCKRGGHVLVKICSLERPVFCLDGARISCVQSKPAEE